MYRPEKVSRLYACLTYLVLMVAPITAPAGPSPNQILPDEADTVAPSAVADLRVVAGRKPGEVRLLWTAVGDDGTVGKARKYAIKYATEPIDDNNWDGAVVAEEADEPVDAGKRERVTIDGLDTDKVYYFVVKVCDDASNWSILSNVARIDLASAVIDTIPPAAIMDLH